MSEEPTDQELAEAIFVYVAEQLNAGATQAQIVATLVEKGMDATTANRIVMDVKQMRNEAVRSGAMKSMAIGGIICVVGLVITIGTYSAAASSQGGGSYVVAWGAIIFGAIQFFRGLGGVMSS